MDNEKHNRVIALRFADGLRVDITREPETHFEAIANMTAAALRSDKPPILPLYEAATAIIPADRLALPLNGDIATLPQPIEPQRQPVPVAGLLHAMRAYGPATIATAGEDTKRDCADKLRAFFAHYDVDIEFNIAGPDWLKNNMPQSVTEAWRG